MGMREPRVSKRDRKLHLSYEVPSRIHSSAIYPIPAPNGSEVILYGHDGGLRVLWRGGRRRKEPRTTQSKPSTVNGTVEAPITIDDTNEQPEQPALVAKPEPDDEYEKVEEEGDSESAYPSIIQDFDFEQPVPALRIAVPALTPAAMVQLPEFVRSNIIVAQLCPDGRVVLLTLPLKPPSSTEKQKWQVGIHPLDNGSVGSIVHGLVIKLFPSEVASDDLDSTCRLMVAYAGSDLKVWDLAIDEGNLRVKSKAQLHHLRSMSEVACPYARNHRQLLVFDRSGTVRVFNARSTDRDHDRPSSRGSASGTVSRRESSDSWTMAYYAPFHASKSSPTLDRRKSILDACWVLGGRGILVLLEDGEWGVWDLQCVGQGGKNIQDFALHGYLGTTSSGEAADGVKQRNSGAKLAPMTPNTRKSKSEKLFSGPEKVAGVAPSGGISIAPTSNRSGSANESIIIWYNNDIYSIPSMQTLWQRGNPSSATGFGSLYTPGLTHVSDINLMNETISSISQFASNPAPDHLGRINNRRDIVVSTEHRLIILQHQSSPAAPGNLLFQQASERPLVEDQRMLDASELDLGGLDRMLDGMAENQGRRRVGFAPS